MFNQLKKRHSVVKGQEPFTGNCIMQDRDRHRIPLPFQSGSMLLLIVVLSASALSAYERLVCTAEFISGRVMFDSKSLNATNSTKGYILGGIMRNLAQLRSIYTKKLRTGVLFDGKVYVCFSINSGGTVLSSSLDSTDIPDTTFTMNFVNAFRSFEFNPDSSRHATAIVHLAFTLSMPEECTRTDLRLSDEAAFAESLLVQGVRSGSDSLIASYYRTWYDKSEKTIDTNNTAARLKPIYAIFKQAYRPDDLKSIGVAKETSDHYASLVNNWEYVIIPDSLRYAFIPDTSVDGKHWADFFTENNVIHPFKPRIELRKKILLSFPEYQEIMRDVRLYQYEYPDRLKKYVLPTGGRMGYVGTWPVINFIFLNTEHQIAFVNFTVSCDYYIIKMKCNNGSWRFVSLIKTGCLD